MHEKILVNELLKIPNAIIIDLRDTKDFESGHIPNAINISAEKLRREPQKYLNKKRVYYLYCQFGISSSKTCSYLYDNGYEVIDVVEGYEGFLLEKNKKV